MIIVNGFQPLTVITKHSILDFAAVLDPPLVIDKRRSKDQIKFRIPYYLMQRKLCFQRNFRSQDVGSLERDTECCNIQ